jgi:hypothetical protein
MPATRSAAPTILGYIYQFDYTIKCLLNLSNENDFVDIENIEDIDIHSCSENSAIQCKYYAGTEYNHSIIAKPIRFMLKHYSDVKSGSAQPINYKLCGFYQSGQNKLIQPITVEFLKEHFLTYIKDKIKHKFHEELTLKDSELSDFLTFLFVDINAEEDSIQFNNIINDLKATFSCDDFEAEHYFYNNALRIVSHTAKQSDVSQRKITKKEFLEHINKKEILFNKWFLQCKGEKKHYTALRKQYFSPININERFFLIEIESGFSKANLKDILLEISNKWTKISNREVNPFCPFIYIHNIEETDLIELKTELSNNNIKLIDGYDFKGASFSQQSITQTANHSNQIKLKIIDTQDNLKLALQIKGRTQEIYQFYLYESFFDSENQYTKHIKIQVKDLISIKEII